MLWLIQENDVNFVFDDSFPREDDGSPRQKILEYFCNDQVKSFRTCMAANGFVEDKCLETKGILDKCASAAFKKVNSDKEFVFWTAIKTNAVALLERQKLLILKHKLNSCLTIFHF